MLPLYFAEYLKSSAMKILIRDYVQYCRLFAVWYARISILWGIYIMGNIYYGDTVLYILYSRSERPQNPTTLFLTQFLTASDKSEKVDDDTARPSHRFVESCM